MDGTQFDALARSLATKGSRRRALIGLVSGTLGLFGASVEEAAAKNCKKIKNKQKRKKCLAKAKPSPPCTRNCAGKTCGDDGCGGSCGDCFRGSCQGGICICPTGEEVCNGACIARCAELELRDPDTCDCCTGNGDPCGLGSQCCSDLCANSECHGRNGLEDCTFGAQCQSGVCEAGKCTCDGDICGGTCVPGCGTRPDVRRNPVTCDCCLANFTLCETGDELECCSGDCNADECAGRPDHDPRGCDFAAQCESNKCEPDCSGNLCTVLKFCQPA
jgi:hypothetical protein